MVIGEGPGSEEDKSGMPFVGPAGQLLDKMLMAIGLSRETNCFIGNIVKCRPPMNRDPAPDEQSSCMPYLDRQIEILKPKAFLAVGRIPAQALLGVKDGIGKLRGRRYEYKGIPLVATYHPSALLRDENYKRPAWEDLKLLRSILDGLA
jgi:DNA polymerase